MLSSRPFARVDRRQAPAGRIASAPEQLPERFVELVGVGGELDRARTLGVTCRRDGGRRRRRLPKGDIARIGPGRSAGLPRKRGTDGGEATPACRGAERGDRYGRRLSVDSNRGRRERAMHAYERSELRYVDGKRDPRARCNGKVERFIAQIDRAT